MNAKRPQPFSFPVLAASVVLSGALAACGGRNVDPGPAGADCSQFQAGELVITEIMFDPPGTDSKKEYLELHNASNRAIDLRGLTLSNGKGETTKKHVFRSVSLPAGGFLVVGDADPKELPPYVQYSYGTDLGTLTDLEATLRVSCGSDVIDEVSYLLKTSDTVAGRAWMLDGALAQDAELNDAQSNFCNAGTEFALGLFGSPGTKNPSCEAVSYLCQDTTTATIRPVVSPLPGELVITEVMANPSGAEETREWFEVKVLTDVDLNGLTLSNGSISQTFSSESCVQMRAGSYALFARSADSVANDGLPTVNAVFTFTLTNSNGTLALRVGESVIDQITYGATTDGVSLQVDPAKSDAQANDAATAFCASSAAYGTSGNKGTPSGANATCPPVVDPNTCVDGESGAARAIVRPVPGDLVVTEVMADSKAVSDDTKGEWFEVLATRDVDLNGVTVAAGSGGGTTVNSADCVRVRANQYALFAHTADSAVNGGLPAVTYTFNFSLANATPPPLVVKAGTTVLDQATFHAGSAAPSGVSKQLDPRKLDAVSNDSDTNFCETPAANTYGLGDRGTPGSANPTCP